MPCAWISTQDIERMSRSRIRPTLGHWLWYLLQPPFGRLLPKLVHSTLRRFLVGTPSDDLRTVAKAATGYVIVGHLNDIDRTHRPPFGRSFRGPPARGAGSFTSKTISAYDLFELSSQARPIGWFDRRREAYMMQKSRFIIESKKKRANNLSIGLFFLAVPEATDHAIGRP